MTACDEKSSSPARLFDSLQGLVISVESNFWRRGWDSYKNYNILILRHNIFFIPSVMPKVMPICWELERKDSIICSFSNLLRIEKRGGYPGMISALNTMTGIAPRCCRRSRCTRCRMLWTIQTTGLPRKRGQWNCRICRATYTISWNFTHEHFLVARIIFSCYKVSTVDVKEGHQPFFIQYQ